jgi:hypothetical protein
MAQIRVAEETVTPDRAKAMLANIKNDRPLSDYTVLNYAETMRQGDWKFNGDPVRLNAEGKLIDGQHRLHAIVKSGKAQHMLIISGLNSDVFDTIDVGKRRSPADLLGIAGYKNVNALAATIRALIIYESGVYWASEAAKQLDYNPSGLQILAYADKNPEVAERVRQIQNDYTYATRIVAPSACGLAFTLAWRMNHQKAEAFMAGVAGLEPTERNDARWVAREYLSRRKAEALTTRITSLQVQAVMVKAANLYFGGVHTTVNLLKFQPKSQWFPRFDGGKRDAREAAKRAADKK